MRCAVQPALPLASGPYSVFGVTSPLCNDQYLFRVWRNRDKEGRGQNGSQRVLFLQRIMVVVESLCNGLFWRSAPQRHSR